jgi:hypothetical protein
MFFVVDVGVFFIFAVRKGGLSDLCVQEDCALGLRGCLVCWSGCTCAWKAFSDTCR